MFFSQNALQQLEEEYLTISGKYARLLDAYLKRSYNAARAREHAQHGFSRRLKTLVRCIENTFKILPPDQVGLPTSEELSDVNINLQAFIFNVFGCVDNLAWIWVSEKGITKDDGSPIPNGWVGLRKKNEFVRKSFSPEFQGYLIGLDEWFDHLSDFRHAVAHRIPLYVPPYVITPDKEAAYRDLEIRKADALNRGALEDYDCLSADQDALGAFKPVMTHSFEEGARPVVFHSQLLADFNTIDELGWKLIEELDH
jgi:hypothetical protein